MLPIKKIHGIWAVVKNGQLLEAYDTRTEAKDGISDFGRDELIEDLDRYHPWHSLYDEEYEQAKKTAA